MWIYALRRVLLATATMMLAVALLYGMIHAVPGDPATILLGPSATTAMKAAVRAQMGLDKPIYLQIVIFFAHLAHGNMGTDVFTHQPVAAIVLEQAPFTLILILTSIGWAVLLGVPLGCLSAVRRNSALDKITGVLSVSTIAIPSFVVALYALLVFAVTLRWLPAIGAGEGGFSDSVRHLVLPAFAVGVSWVGYIARIVRASMLEVLNENHIRMMRGFGLPERRIIFRYALPLAILPTVTLIGVGMAYLLSAAVFAEVVFARPGIGALMVHAVISRNYPIVMGCVVVTTGLFVISTTLADLLNALLNPRMREGL